MRLGPGGTEALARARQKLAEHGDDRVIACPCGASSDTVISEVDRHGLPHRVVLCEECGLVRADPQPSQAVLDWFYADVYRPLYGPSNTDTKALFESKRWKAEPLHALLERANAIAPVRKVIDIGCGGGWTIASLHEQGWSVVGYDYDTRFLAIGRERGMDLRHGGVPEAIAAGERADVVVCAHVLEHVPEPAEFTAQLARLVGDDGLLYLEVPHSRRIPKLGYDSLLYWQRAHLWDFRAEHLRAVAASAGFEPVVLEEDSASVYGLFRRGARGSGAMPKLGPLVRQELLRYERSRKTLRARGRRVVQRARETVQSIPGISPLIRWVRNARRVLSSRHS
jgi:SAM-dependent methyltransferase